MQPDIVPDCRQAMTFQPERFTPAPLGQTERVTVVLTCFEAGSGAIVIVPAASSATMLRGERCVTRLSPGSARSACSSATPGSPRAPCEQAFYLHVGLVYGSLLLRILGDLAALIEVRARGGLLNVAAMPLFGALTGRAARRAARPRGGQVWRLGTPPTSV